ncbi:unnamed protein product [Rotaria sordida]|uniref:Uncharacterized protein n=1 Tax=Rotaria sordida TaxID=392033 RepID=A0A814R3V4_9BILA|nr:unnamed protein product [Rotaria sordida]CAF1112333.1 unnamed protein product [Rotaria sordida]CAF1127973.1 unnamed protein product [Rotaria sordida]CAF3805768.1 unnamed protein product [Rotaria sordida]CAF3810216.1 unnamed protein product [Rotaria sordida]
MATFYLFIIIVLLSLNFFQSINSESTNSTSIFNLYDNSTIRINIIENKINQTSTSTNTYFNTTTIFIVNTKINSSYITTKTNEIILTTTTSQSSISLNTPSITESTTFDINNNHSKKSSSRSKWWLLIALIITVVAVTSIAIIYHQRRQTPYRRFLRNWQARDDDADNTILQLEQPDLINNQWPHQISLV